MRPCELREDEHSEPDERRRPRRRGVTSRQPDREDQERRQAAEEMQPLWTVKARDNRESDRNQQQKCKQDVETRAISRNSGSENREQKRVRCRGHSEAIEGTLRAVILAAN